MGYPAEGSRAYKIAKDYADKHNVSVKAACDELGLITLEDIPPVKEKASKEMSI